MTSHNDLVMEEAEAADRADSVACQQCLFILYIYEEPEAQDKSYQIIMVLDWNDQGNATHCAIFVKWFSMSLLCYVPEPMNPVGGDYINFLPFHRCELLPGVHGVQGLLPDVQQRGTHQRSLRLRLSGDTGPTRPFTLYESINSNHVMLEVDPSDDYDGRILDMRTCWTCCSDPALRAGLRVPCPASP